MTSTATCFKSVTFNYANEGINPIISCPSCRKEFQPKYKPIITLPTKYDFKGQITLTCSYCNYQIKPYVGVHKTASDGGSLIISDNPIEDNWWL